MAGVRPGAAGLGGVHRRPRGSAVFDTRQRLKDALGAYAAWRACGPAESRLAASTWDAACEHLVRLLPVGGRGGARGGRAVHLPAGPRHLRPQGDGRNGQPGGAAAAETAREDQVPGAGLRVDVRAALAGQRPDGPRRTGAGPELARNAASGTWRWPPGLRLQEFTWLLAAEIPALPPRAVRGPIPVPGPGGNRQGPQVPHDRGSAMRRWRGAPLPGPDRPLA